jgi:hypothetical protein
MRAKLAWGPRLAFDAEEISVVASGTFCRTMSEAKTDDADKTRQADNRAKGEASVLIISISTKTIVGLFLPPCNKNLRQP